MLLVKIKSLHYFKAQIMIFKSLIAKISLKERVFGKANHFFQEHSSVLLHNIHV